jgi:hypothetical protein
VGTEFHLGHCSITHSGHLLGRDRYDMLSFISFLCFLYLTHHSNAGKLGLGAGGGKASSAEVSTATYTTLYAVFALSGFFGGSIMNTIGPKWTMTVISSNIYHNFPQGTIYIESNIQD